MESVKIESRERQSERLEVADQQLLPRNGSGKRAAGSTKKSKRLRRNAGIE